MRSFDGVIQAALTGRRRRQHLGRRTTIRKLRQQVFPSGSPRWWRHAMTSWNAGSRRSSCGTSFTNSAPKWSSQSPAGTEPFRVYRVIRIYISSSGSVRRYLYIHCESKKLGHFFTAYNFRNIEQIFTKFGTNQSLFILNIVPEFI